MIKQHQVSDESLQRLDRNDSTTWFPIDIDNTNYSIPICIRKRFTLLEQKSSPPNSVVIEAMDIIGKEIVDVKIVSSHHLI